MSPRFCRSRRWSLGLAFAALATVLCAGTAAAPAHAAQAARCAAPGSHTVASSSLVRVYSKPAAKGRRAFFGCLLDSGRTRKLTGLFDRRVAIGGTWVARPRYVGVHDLSIAATDLATGRTHSDVLDDIPQRLTVSAHGTIAWLLRATFPTYADYANSAAFTVVPATTTHPMLLVTYPAHGLAVLRGRPEGSFSKPAPIAATHRPGLAVAHDLDGDGVADLVAVGNHGVVILPGRPDGTFGPDTALRVPGLFNEGVAVGDLDRDGHPDIIANQGDDDGLWLLRGLGGFAFASPRQVGEGFDYFDGPLVTDGDGDGIPDLVVADGGIMRHGNGDGTLADDDAELYSGDINSYTVIADVNHDGIGDRLNSNEHDVTDGTRHVLGGGFSVQLSRGGGSFAPPVVYGDKLDLDQLAVGDVDGDGNPDAVSAVARADYGMRAVVFKGRGDGTFADPADAPSATAPIIAIQQSELVDVDGDGKLDLVASSPDDGLAVLRGHGDGTFSTVQAANDVFALGATQRDARELRHAVVLDARTFRFAGERLSWSQGGKRVGVRVR
jgi:hypothetical protein